jgi:hypothetical protein
VDHLLLKRSIAQPHPLTVAKCEWQPGRDDGSQIHLETLETSWRGVPDRRHQEIHLDIPKALVSPALPRAVPLLVPVRLEIAAAKPLGKSVVAPCIQHRHLQANIDVERADVWVVVRRLGVDQQRRHKSTHHNQVVKQIAEDRRQRQTGRKNSLELLG